WTAARAAIEREVQAYVARHPARFGTPKGELKAGLKSELDASLFDAAFQSLAEEGSLEVRGERVRPGGEPWEPPAAALRLLERVESELESAGLSVPDAPRWQAGLGAQA